jgi:hypothetical protein
MPLCSEFRPAGLGGGERGLCPRADLFPLVLCERGKHMHHEFRGMCIIDRDELNAALHQIRDERDVAGDPIEYGDNQRGLAAFAGREGSLQLGAIRSLTLVANSVAYPAASWFRYVRPNTPALRTVVRRGQARYDVRLVVGSENPEGIDSCFANVC